MKVFIEIKRHIPVWRAQYWQYYYRLKNSLLVLGVKYRITAAFIVLSVLLVLTWLLAANINADLEPYFSVQERFDGFQTLLVSLGGALIGATAIAFSLIMFAMQVNVERMPHGLFRKFSSDPKLLGSFAVTFSIAITITCLSLIPDESWVTVAALGAVWGSVLIVIFFLIAYRRALSLISPTEQLAILVSDTKKNLLIWGRAAQRATPLLAGSPEENEEEQGRRFEHDMERTTYFQLNPGWTMVAQRNILHCISFARRYAEQGDHEVAGIALNAILAINVAYIDAKGKTFFSHHHFNENSLAVDSFINDTLEHLRQNIQTGISRGDEQQIEQTFKTMLGLCHIYMTIDYPVEYESKYHARMAAGYLSSAVEAVVPHNMPDVLMEGVRLMGNSAQLILSHKETDIVTISEKIAEIACTGAVNKKYRPVTQVAVEQLAKLTFELIRSQSHDINFAIDKVRGDVKLIAEIFLLKIPDTPLERAHSTSLSPYYSCTSNDALQAWLTDLINALLKADKEDEAAQRVISHIKQWADELYRTGKELFLLAIEKRSAFTFDIIHWIVHVTKLLLAVSNADACSEHNRDEIRRSARWLISIFSWAPDNKEVVTFIENYQLTENLFEAAIDAKKCGCDDVAHEIRDLLLSWAFKAGKYQTGRGILEQACYGLACLNIIFDIDDGVLLSAIDKRVSQDSALGLELRQRASSDVREKADAYHHNGYGLRAIESVMGQVDQNRLRTLLIGISDHLTPEVVNQLEEQND